MTEPEPGTPPAAASPDPHAMHQGHAGHAQAEPGAEAAGQDQGPFTCPMHPAVKANKPGTCPICGMTLVRKPEAPKP